MEIRYQIFISSTYNDLIIERQKVTQAILKLYHFPIGMEMFHADNEEQWCQIKSTIDMSDYYVLIIGRCCGTIIESEGVSYTEKEYNYAKSKGIPILSFIISDDAKKEVYGVETPKQQKIYRNFVKKVKELPCEYWHTPDELACQVTSTLSIKFQKANRNGWIPRNFLEKPTIGDAWLSGEYLMYYYSYSNNNTDIIVSTLVFEERGTSTLFNNINTKNECGYEYKYSGHYIVQGNLIYVYLNNVTLYERGMLTLFKQMGENGKLLGLFLALTSSGYPVCVKVALIKKEDIQGKKINLNILGQCIKNESNNTYSKDAFIISPDINNVFFSDNLYE